MNGNKSHNTGYEHKSEDSRHCKEVLVLWQGFGVESVSWEPVVNLTKDVLDVYHALQKQAVALFDERDDDSEEI